MTNTKQSSATKRPLVAGVAVLACVAACTAPLLLAGGLTVGLGALLSGSEIVPGIIPATTALGVYLWWRRKRRAGVSGAAVAAGGRSCGCGPAGSCGTTPPSCPTR